MKLLHGHLVRGGLAAVLLLTAALLALQMARPAPARAQHQPGIYRGTHAGGGTVTFQAGPQGILTFSATDIPGEGCLLVEDGARWGGRGLEIVNDAFDDQEQFGITPRGRFLPNGRAEGTFMLYPSPSSTCRTATPIAWTAELSGPLPATRTPTPTRTSTPAVTRTPAPPTGNRTALYLGETEGGAPVLLVAITNSGAFFVRSLRIGALPPAAATAITYSPCEARDPTLTGAEGLFLITDNRVELRSPGTTDDGDGYEVVISGTYGQNGFTGTVAWEFPDRQECSTTPVNWSAALVQGAGDPLVPDMEPAAPTPTRTPARTPTPVTSRPPSGTPAPLTTGRDFGLVGQRVTGLCSIISRSVFSATIERVDSATTVRGVPSSGQWLLVIAALTNDGPVADDGFLISVLVDSQGRRFEALSSSEFPPYFFMVDEYGVLTHVDDIQPGVTGRVLWVFEVPRTADGLRLASNTGQCRARPVAKQVGAG